MRRLSLAETFYLMVALNFVLYPGIFLFLQSPMIGNSWTLGDPSVSIQNFIPGIKTLKFELFENANVLWSSLRNMGAPVLANEVQVGPLYPLTLAFIWVPEPYFWNATTIARLILMWVGTFLIASEILKLHTMPALVFTIIFAGSMFVARWINHPWQNGFVAGIWFLFFAARALELSRTDWGARRFFTTLGIAVSSYALITCGFPEASVMAALLSLLVIAPMFVAFAVSRPPAVFIARLFQDWASGVLSGALLASPQIFALLEHIAQTAPDFRSVIGLHQFPSLSEFLYAVTRFGRGPPAGEMIQIFGLIPLTLFVVGVLSRLARLRTFDTLDAISVLTITFYFLKCFPIWPSFNEWVGALPLLRQSWFTVYFLPIFLFGFALLSARGAEFIFSQLGRRKISGLLLVLILSGALVVTLIWLAGTQAQSIEIRYLAPILIIFALFFSVMGIAVAHPRNAKILAWCCVMTIILLLVESYFNKPVSFADYRSTRYRAMTSTDDIGHTIINRTRELNIEGQNLRESSEAGSYLQLGLATIDNGAPAILTERAQIFRTSLFDVEWKGYLPLKSEKVKGAYRIAGRNIMLHEGSNPPLSADFLNLGRIEERHILFDKRSPGRAFLARRCFNASNPKNAADIIGSDSFREGDIVVEELNDLEVAICDRLEQSSWHKVAVTKDHGSMVQLASVQGPAILTLNDSFYPGWTATDRSDGKEISIRPGNINCKTVLLPESKIYNIEFVYRPQWLFISELLACIAVSFWLASAVTMFFTVRVARSPFRA
jgi:hypothetical protein